VKINADNAYLPATIASRFGTLTYPGGTQLNGVQPNQSLTFGWTQRTIALRLVPPRPAMRRSIHENLCSAIGLPCNFSNRALMRGVFTLEGSIGSDWSWNTYIQSSSVRLRQRLYNNPITARFNNAIDAVVVTPQNQGASGLALGSIQCRALLNPATATGVDVAGCQPMNLFGYQNVSGAAYAFVNPGTNHSSGILDNETVYLNKLLCRHPRKACCHSIAGGSRRSCIWR